ncbi:tetratricopeptide repeat protein, partial [Rivihabitans pingtungensis]|uniref:tetratricopeptide repeat protein n=1 Tax=Rivihabitans pingtungensis TaxID=1054498 RepID=UPI002FDB3F06
MSAQSVFSMSDASEPLSIDTEIDLKAAFDSAIVHHQAGRLSQAELLYRMVLRTLPLHPDANHNLGVIAVQLGQPEHALPLLNTALTQDLTQGRFWISYIDALLRAGHLDEADQWLAQGRKSGLAGPQVDELAQRLAVAREPKPLAKAGKNRKAKHAQPPLAVQQKLVALFNQGQTEACEQLARELTETYPRHPLAWKTLGAVVTQLGRTAEGVQIMRTAAELAPQDVELLSNLGVTLVMMGQLEEAEHCYRRALKLQPHSSSLHAFLADTLFLLLRYPQAEQHARKAIELNPNNEIAYHNLGSVLRASS